MNPDIISEINSLVDASEEVQNFLLWLTEFEKENIDLDRFAYKSAIENKVKELLNSAI